jgi:hypothetical protein
LKTNKVQKDKNIPVVPDTSTMLSQKTYEDFNKKRPNPSEIKKPPLANVPPQSAEPNPNDDIHRTWCRANS